MQLEDYFDFLSPDDIRIKGTRIGIETVLYDFIHRCRTPEEIAQSYRTLDLEQVYATILYYLHNKEAVSTYLANWIEHRLCNSICLSGLKLIAALAPSTFSSTATY